MQGLIGKTKNRVPGRVFWLALGLAVILMILEAAFAGVADPEAVRRAPVTD